MTHQYKYINQFLNCSILILSKNLICQSFQPSDFTDQIDVSKTKEFISNPISITDLGGESNISISGRTYFKNGNNFTTESEIS